MEGPEILVLNDAVAVPYKQGVVLLYIIEDHSKERKNKRL